MAADSGIDIGDVVRLARRFTNEAGAAADPDTVTLTVRKPDGSVATVTNHKVTDSGELALVASLLGLTLASSTGVYAGTVEPDDAGRWRYRWESSGGVMSAEEGAFNVRRRRVPEPEVP